MSGIGLKIAPVLAVALIFSGVSHAQTQTAPNPRNDQNEPHHFDSQAQQPGRSNESLSERLDRTDGVIHPPAHVDPKIQETPPATGDKGVVHPPSDLPGRNPTVTPK